jgi:hypothetical protein
VATGLDKAEAVFDATQDSIDLSLQQSVQNGFGDPSSSYPKGIVSTSPRG